VPEARIARVVSRLRALPDDAAVLAALREPTTSGIDPFQETVATTADAAGITLPEGSRASAASVIGEPDDHVEVRAEGPGLLVIAESWDRGWRVRVDGTPGRVLRVEHARMGVVVPPGVHRFELDYRPPGFAAGLVLAGCGAALLVFARS
jgi:hypothetical protein